MKEKWEAPILEELDIRLTESGTDKKLTEKSNNPGHVVYIPPTPS